MIHIHAITYTPVPKRCDVRVSKRKQQDTRTRLANEIAEGRMDAKLPRHYSEHRAYQRQGGQ